MKNLLSLLLITSFLVACSSQTKEAETSEIENKGQVEEVKSNDGFYGEQIDVEGAIAMNVFLTEIEANDSMQVKMKGTIDKTCKMKGCWMTIVTNEGETMRVSFKDYGFFVPQEGMEGKEVIFEGMAKKKLTSVQELKHYAQDGGATKAELAAITEDSEELTFVANGVIIKEVKMDTQSD